MQGERLNRQFLLGLEVPAVHLHDLEFAGVMRLAGCPFDFKDPWNLVELWDGAPNNVANTNPWRLFENAVENFFNHPMIVRSSASRHRIPLLPFPIRRCSR